jgi:hypothetical protein
MGDRQKAIQELRKQMFLARQRLGPEGLKELEKLAKSMQDPKAAPPPPSATALPPGMVPYDKEAALAALELFIKNHGDPKEFEKRLLEMIKKTSH